MPKLPSVQTLGDSPTPRPQRDIQGYRAGQVESVAIQAAEGLSDTGRQMMRAGDELQSRVDQQEYSRARSAFLRAKVAQDNAYDADQNYQTWEKRYGDSLGKARGEISKSISNARVREIFDNETELDLQRGLAGIGDKVRLRVKDQGRADLVGLISQNREAALNAPDEQTRTGLITATNDAINAALGQGFLSAQEAVQQREQFVKDYQKDRKDRFTASFGAALDQQRNNLLSDPSKFSAAEADLTARLEASGLPQAEKDKLRAQMKGGLGLSIVQAGILSNPSQAKAALESGQWDGYLDADKKAALLHGADVAIRVREAEAKAAQAEARSRFVSDFEIGLTRGEKGYADIQRAYDAGSITPVQRTNYVQYLDKENVKKEAAAEMVRRVGAAGDGGQPLDPKSPDDKKALNLHYEGTLQSWEGLSGEEVVAKSIDYSQRYGMVPEKFKGIIRGNLRSGDASQAIMASDTITRLRNLNPQLLNDFAEEDLRLGNIISSQVASGIPPKDALVMAQESLKVTPQIRESRKAQYDEERGKTEASRTAQDKAWMQGKLNSVWSIDPSIDPIMYREFDSIARQEFERTGSLDASRQFALDHVNRQWGRSRVGGNLRYMKWAPERFYSVPNLSPDDNAKWMNEQLVSDLSAGAFVNPDNPLTADRIQLFADPTRVGPDGRPAYTVAIKGENGVFYGVKDAKGNALSWVPHWDSSEEKKRGLQRTSQQVEDARRMREAILNPAEPTVFNALQ